MRPATDDKSPAVFSFGSLLAGSDAIRVVFDGKIYLSRSAAGADCESVSDCSVAKIAALTDRELAVLRGVAEGQGYKEIAQELKISVKSVETYRARLARKIGCSTRAKLIRYAVRNGLVAP